MRALLKKDIATGIVPVTDDYKTLDSFSAWHIKNEIPVAP